MSISGPWQTRIIISNLTLEGNRKLFLIISFLKPHEGSASLALGKGCTKSKVDRTPLPLPKAMPHNLTKEAALVLYIVFSFQNVHPCFVRESFSSARTLISFISFRLKCMPMYCVTSLNQKRVPSHVTYVSLISWPRALAKPHARSKKTEIPVHLRCFQVLVGT